MLELPEVLTVSRQLRENIIGKTIDKVLPPTKEHKFCWFNGDPARYEAMIKGSAVNYVDGFGLFVEIGFDNGYKLCFSEGVNVRLISSNEIINKSYQLVVRFDDNMSLMFTVAMYGNLYIYDGDFDNEYYQKSRITPSPFSKDFDEYFNSLMKNSGTLITIKALLATGQRFPGLGNGVLQDILFVSRIHPRRRLKSLSPMEVQAMHDALISVLEDMTKKGGRDTEKDIFGNPGGYETRLSKYTIHSKCTVCGGQIKRENYLGGSIYFCPTCQPLPNAWRGSER